MNEGRGFEIKLLQETHNDLQLRSLPKRPMRGWVRSIREALGMSARQLADGIGVKPPRISELEKAECQGNITLKTLRRVAEAMDCELYYALIPKTNLEDTLRKQALKVAAADLDTVSHTMRLEEQGPTAKEEAAQVAKMAEEWVRNPPRRLWDKR